MFGYVRPVRDELKCKDLDLYRATYCGLCRTMRKRLGLFASMTLNFDFTFLALLLAPPEGEQVTCCHRCPFPPFRRSCMCEVSDGLELVADESIILTYWQLRDSISDGSGWTNLKARLAQLFLRRAYSRAAVARPEFDHQVATQIQDLQTLEESNCNSLDRPADTFATLLCCAVPNSSDDPVRDRAMADLLYHLGRWIYLIDARDDLEADIKNNNYNPIQARFGGESFDEPLMLTLNHSLNRMRAACALLELGRQTALIENVLNFGLPTVQRAVFEGRWNDMKKQKIWRNNR